MEFREFLNSDPKYMTDDQIKQAKAKNPGRAEELETELGGRSAIHAAKRDSHRSERLIAQATFLRRQIRTLEADHAERRQSGIRDTAEDERDMKELKDQLAKIQHELMSLECDG